MESLLTSPATAAVRLRPLAVAAIATIAVAAGLVASDVQHRLTSRSADLTIAVRYRVVGSPGYSATDLKTIQDWTLDRRFKAVPGVLGVVSHESGATVQGAVLVRGGSAIQAAEAEIASINRSGVLPPGVRLERIRDHARLVELSPRFAISGQN